MKNLQKEYGLYINGKWQPASDGATFKTYSPATGEELAVCAEATREDVDAAVKAAHAAWANWKNTTPVERAVILNKIADIIDANAQHLAEVESLDNGKPIRETSMIDIPMSADHFRYFAAAIRTEEGTATMLDNNTLSLVLHEPIGVVGQIIPWNFPFLMAAWKLAPALAAGDCIVLKPSSTTSLSVLELVRLIEGVLPAGVLNVITGKGSKSGQYVLEHPGFAKLAFTGSTEVGPQRFKKHILRFVKPQQIREGCITEIKNFIHRAEIVIQNNVFAFFSGNISAHTCKNINIGTAETVN